MIKFEKPINLNGQELREELRQQGIAISDDRNAVNVDENNELLLDIDSKYKAKAAVVVANHNGTVIAPEPTITDKLSSVGLNIDDLKMALGLS